MLSSVSHVAREAKQPRGGYLPLPQFKLELMDDGIELYPDENITPAFVGTAVDYLTRFVLTGNREEAFCVPIRGYRGRVKSTLDIGRKSMLELFREYGEDFEEDYGVLIPADKKKRIDIKTLITGINGLDSDSITSACRAVVYDAYARGRAYDVIDPATVSPDAHTIENIVKMVNRCVSVVQARGKPVIKTAFDFFEDKDEKDAYDRFHDPLSGYTFTVADGDGDILTEDTMYDLKVSKSKPSSKDTLQVLMYWIMGQHSKLKIYKNNRFIILLNPRRGEVYTIDALSIDPQIIKTVEKEIICYE